MNRVACSVVLVNLFLAAAAVPLHAAVVPIAYYRAGEDDPGAAAGNLGNATTVDSIAALDFSRSGSPAYSASTGSPISELSLDFTGGGNYSRSGVIFSDVDNVGMELSVFPVSVPTSNNVILYNGNSGSNGFGLMVRNGQWSMIAGGKTYGDTGIPVEAGTWNHLAVVRDGGTTRLYVNGRPQGSSYTTAPNTPVGSTYFGQNFPGRIDEVRFFTFNPGEFKPGSDLLNPITPLAYYRLGDDDPGAAGGSTGNATTTDALGALDLNRSGSPAYTSDTGHPLSSLGMDFAGGGSYTRSGVVTTEIDNWGIEAWVYPFDANQPDTVIAYNGNGGNSGFGLFTRNGQWGTLVGGKTYGDTGVPVVADQWTHLAAIRVDGLLQLYVNGVPMGSGTTIAPNDPSGSISIGGNFNGLLDEVRFFAVNPDLFVSTRDLLNVPEPGTLVLMALASAAFAVCGLRRRRLAARHRQTVP